MADPFNITQVDVPGILQAYGQRQQQNLENMYRQKQLARQDVLDARADATYNRGEQVRTGLTTAYDPATGKIDPVKARNAFLGAGDIAGVMDFDDKELARQKGELENYKAVNEAALNLLGSVRDQTTYDAAVAQAKQIFETYGHGQHFPTLPAKYDPAVVQQLQEQTLNTKERLTYGLQKAQAEETRRHNQAGEGTAAGNLAVAQGNLAVRREAVDAIKKNPGGASTADLLGVAGLGN